MSATQQAQQQVAVQQVATTIRSALSINTAERQAAEAALSAWESDAAPGFVISLIRIIEEHVGIDEPTRLLAAVIAKNAVGSSWRKTLGTREWSRVPAEEKGAVREAVLRLLLTDPSDRVSIQVALLLRNVCQFDFPGQWQSPVDALLTAASCVDPVSGAQLPPECGLRALKALKQVLRGLQTKRFVADATAPGTPFTVVTERLNAERKLFKERLAAAVAPLQALLARHMQAFMTCADGWQLHGAFARAAAASCTELTLLLPSREAMPGGDAAATSLLEGVHTACGGVMRGQPLAGDPGGAAALAAWNELGGKLHERLAAMVTAHMAACPLPFGPLLPHFLNLFVNSALVALDAETLRAMRSKRRVLLVRFIAKALLCPYYRAEWLEVNVNLLAVAGQGGHVPMNAATQVEVDRARTAHDALTAMLAPPQVGPLVEALVAKYVALSREELEEWQSDPEGYIRSLELEAAPDADTPRPVGVGLLLCMLERGGEGPGRALIDLAARLQSQGDGAPPDVLLMREACYRAIGEGFPHVSSFISFASWYSAEIAPQLRDRLPAFKTPGGANIIMAVLQARALWLVGACCAELPQQQWVEAYGLCVAHMSSADLVVALQAVQAVMMMTAALLDDQALLDQANAAQLQASKQAARGGAAIDAALNAAEALDQEAVVAARERLAWRGEALQALLSELLSSCFGLLGRLSEAESRVRLLQLVSVVAEAAGEALRPHLGALAAALPQVWEAATSAAQRPDADTGSVARLHSALMAVLTHLVGKLRGAALEDAGVQGVLYPLLQYATDPSSSEADVLLEEALKLWAVVQGAQPAVNQQLVDLLPRMAALLRRGRDNTAAFQLIEGYLLLGGGGALQPYGESIAAALATALNNVARTVADACAPQGPPAGQQQQPPPQPHAPQQRGPHGGQRGPLASEVTQEGLAAAALVDVFLQLYPSDVSTLLAGSFTAMARLIADARVPTAGVQMKAHNVMEGFLEVLGRLFLAAPNMFPALLQAVGAAESSEQQQQQQAGNPVAVAPEPVSAVQQRFLDRWLSVANVTLLEEAIGVRHMAMLGRFRRRMAAAGLSTLINSSVLSPSALDPKSIANLASLMIKVVREIPEFKSDVAHLDGMDFAGELGSDYVLAARVNLSKNDVIRSLPLFDTFRTALTALAGAVGGPAGLGSLLVTHGRPGVQESAQQLLDGKLEEVLAAKRQQIDAARRALLAGWHGSGGSSGDDVGDADAADMS